MVAVTGLILLGYVVGHMLGNLQIFAGPERINAYAAFLHSMPVVLWAVRIILIGAFVIHILVTIQLAAQNRRARGQKYERQNHVQSRLATRTMILSGLVVFAFVAYHLAHFTIRATDRRFHALPRGEHDVYTMVILGFQHPLVSGFYIVAIFLLALHLSHGFQSVFQTLGANSATARTPITAIGYAFAAIIFLGYISIPVAVLADLLKI